MREIQFEWDEWNISHIAQHDVEPYEVEEVFEHFHTIRKTRQGRRLAYGQTLDGRYLFVVSVYRDSRIYPITARSMTRQENRFYRRRRR
ncbi:TPA: BrnT family toxin [Candidatus Poribacteria bacterium]|nr:BrnT family toxin [Candidatus Poribacteria bacterium]